MVTMNDVALRANVSVSTVSRVLSEKTFVCNDTRERVLKAMLELNYSPNMIARGLKGVGTKTIALLMPNICNPSFPSAAKGAEDAARKRNYMLLVCNTDEDIEAETQYVQNLRARLIDGIIFSTVTNTTKHLQELFDAGMPMVQLMRYQEGRINSVHLDNFRAAYIATEHLIKIGCSRIAILKGDSNMHHLNMRFNGFLQALKDYGVPYYQILTEDLHFGDDNGLIASSRLIEKEEPFDGILCMNDYAAFGALKVIREKGLTVPKDVSICAIDNLEFSRFLNPSLTTVEQPLYDMGFAACNVVMDIIDGKCANSDVEKIFCPQLIIRNSTKC